MQDEIGFLRQIIAQPANPDVRSAFANWLEARGDPRGLFLRLDPTLERISNVDWLEKSGQLKWYVGKFPQIERMVEQHRASEALRRRRRELASSLDPTWVTLIDTLGCPFEPFRFFDNSGELRTVGLPFAELIGTRGAVVTFESDFRDEHSWDQGLMLDLRFLCQLKLEECAYGAASCPVHPFICQLRTTGGTPAGSNVLAALHPRHFSSKYIRDLDAPMIQYPGYHPGEGRGIQNDEIHNDFASQYIFQKQDEDHEEEVNEFDGTHGVLKRFVVDGKLFYVLLHTTPEVTGQFQLSSHVVLFAVGRSPHGERLMGVVTHQVCHNLCD